MQSLIDVDLTPAAPMRPAGEGKTTTTDKQSADQFADTLSELDRNADEPRNRPDTPRNTDETKAQNETVQPTDKPGEDVILLSENTFNIGEVSVEPVHVDTPPPHIHTHTRMDVTDTTYNPEDSDAVGPQVDLSPDSALIQNGTRNQPPRATHALTDIETLEDTAELVASLGAAPVAEAPPVPVTATSASQAKTDANLPDVAGMTVPEPEVDAPSTRQARADTVDTTPSEPATSLTVTASMPSGEAVLPGMTSLEAQTGTATQPALGTGVNLPGTTSAATAGAAGLSQVQTSPPAPLMVVAPADIVGIVSETLASDNSSDLSTIEIQLDPPELGRVSIDFRFEGQTLQQVTISAETPEAIRRLREMHFDLVQTLEQNGLSGQDMSFEQRDFSQQQNQSQALGTELASMESVLTTPEAALIPEPRHMPVSGLNLKL